MPAGEVISYVMSTRLKTNYWGRGPNEISALESTGSVQIYYRDSSKDKQNNRYLIMEQYCYPEVVGELISVATRSSLLLCQTSVKRVTSNLNGELITSVGLYLGVACL